MKPLRSTTLCFQILKKVKNILKPAKDILAEGSNWFVLKMSDLTNEEYMDLDNKGLFPYFCYDMSIDDFIKL